jgi:peptide/nickel transport system permease protein
MLERAKDAAKVAVNVIVLGVGVALLGWAILWWDDVGKAAMRLDLRGALTPPLSFGAQGTHLLGTDALGRDLLARIAVAVRDAVLPLWLVVLLAHGAGTGVGVLAMLSGGAGESELRPAHAWSRFGVFAGVRALDVGAAIVAGVPVGILAFAGAVWREEVGLLPVAAALAAVCGVRGYLLARDLHRQTRSLAWWTADAALGGAPLRRVVRHGIFGAWRRPMLDALGFHLKIAVGIEAALSYLGFGIAEPAPSLGNMLASHFDLYLKGQWQVLAVVVGALALVTAVPAAAVDLVQRVGSWRSRPTGRDLDESRDSFAARPNVATR